MRKIAAGLAFLIVVLSVWAGGNLYLARRLVLEPAWPTPLREGLLLSLVVLASLPILQPIAERTIGCRRSRWIAWPGYVYMGLTLASRGRPRRLRTCSSP
jgi:hypothetical protein